MLSATTVNAIWASQATDATARLQSIDFLASLFDTTTSSRLIVFSTSTTLMTVLPFNAISWVSIPIKENINVLSVGFTVSVYFPLASLMVPRLAPFTTTLTPAIGLPDMSDIIPVTVIGSSFNRTNEERLIIRIEKKNV